MFSAKKTQRGGRGAGIIGKYPPKEHIWHPKELLKAQKIFNFHKLLLFRWGIALPSVTRTAQFVFSMTKGEPPANNFKQDLSTKKRANHFSASNFRCPERSVVSQFVSESLGVSTATLYSMFRFPDSNTVHLQVKQLFWTNWENNVIWPAI